VGGRILTVPAADGGLPVELGAEFIHGLPPELIHLVDEAGLTRFELEGEYRCYREERGVGRLGPCGDQREIDQLFEELGHLQLPPDSPDLSFQEFVVQRGLGAEAVAWATNYVEGFNAADADRISIRSLAKQQAAEDAISGDRLFRVVEGYSRVPEFLLRRFLDAGGEFFAAAPVLSVEWKPGWVEVTTLTDRVFQASSAILTMPLGVLQARSVAFTPQPAQILETADRLAMGPVARVVYEFDRGLQSALEGLSFLFAPEATPPTWWTTNPMPSSMLTGWVAGRKVGKLKVDELPDTGVATLAAILGSSPLDVRKHLVRRHLHDWQIDPHSLGAYTYVPRGAICASDELSVPVEGTLFFAGEHTDTSGHWGTVHGALRSGYRAAQQILAR
jgi:monoamine oxidase